MKAVTTFSPKGYEEYAEIFLMTYVENMSLPLVAYVEEEPDFKHDLIEYRDIYGIPDVAMFISHAEHLQRQAPKNYLYDAAKFSYKVFAQLDVFKESPKEEIFWFDADIVFLRPLSKWLLKGLLKDVCLAYLGRDTYTEAGFIGFDTAHKNFPMFFHHYEDMYKKRRIFELNFWTDCHAFDEARRGIKGRDLTQGKGMEHVFCKSPLAPYMDHLKGGRKKIGYSPEREQIHTANTDSRIQTA